MTDEAKRTTQQQLLLIVVMLGVLAATLPGALRSVGVLRSQGPATSNGPAASLSVVERNGGGSSGPMGQPRYLASSLRDPFRSLLPADEVLLPAPSPVVVNKPSAQEEGVMPVLALQGILWGATMPMAIIDNEVYTVGDVVQGATITRIGRFGVTLELEGRTMQLTMAESEPEATAVEIQ